MSISIQPGKSERVGLASLDPSTRMEVMAKALKALADPIRLAILRMLSSRDEMTVSELVAGLPVSQPRVSAHLACLTECGYTQGRREGRHAFYRIAAPRVAEVIEAVEDHASANLERILDCIGCAVPELGSPSGGTDNPAR
jgi:DNA-binding transcriptional ArsR family regulator